MEVMVRCHGDVQVSEALQLEEDEEANEERELTQVNEQV